MDLGRKDRHFREIGYVCFCLKGLWPAMLNQVGPCALFQDGVKEGHESEHPCCTILWEQAFRTSKLTQIYDSL